MDGHTAKEMADEITQKMGNKFKCLNGWLQQFNEQWNVAQEATSRKDATTNIDSAEKWCSKGHFQHG
jgi:hypothetical protein